MRPSIPPEPQLISIKKTCEGSQLQQYLKRVFLHMVAGGPGVQ